MLTRENVTTDDVLRIYVLRLMNTTTRHGRLYSQLGPPNNFDFATAGPTAQVRPPLALIYIERSPPRCPPIYLSVLCQLPYTTHESNLHSIKHPESIHPAKQPKCSPLLFPSFPHLSPRFIPNNSTHKWCCPSVATDFSSLEPYCFAQVPCPSNLSSDYPTNQDH